MASLRSLYQLNPQRSSRILPLVPRSSLRSLATTTRLHAQPPPPTPGPQPQDYSTEPPRYNFYRTHGRAFFKSFTLAFLTYQMVHWTWLLFESEQEKDEREAEIRRLQGEVRLLDEGRGSHTSKGKRDG
jgi:hypothetical protein